MHHHQQEDINSNSLSSPFITVIAAICSLVIANEGLAAAALSLLQVDINNMK